MRQFAASFSPRPLMKPSPLVRVRWREHAVCACVVADLQEFYYVESFDFDLGGQIAMEQISTGGGDACEDIGYDGGNDAGSLATMDFLSPTPTKWQLGLDNGVTAITLYKDAGGDCPIASPVGTYTGDGYTAIVADDPF